MAETLSKKEAARLTQDVKYPAAKSTASIYLESINPRRNSKLICTVNVIVNTLHCECVNVAHAYRYMHDKYAQTGMFLFNIEHFISLTEPQMGAPVVT